MLHSYPNVYQLGHKLVSNVLDGYVLVQEKIDGSQISFGIDNLGDLRIRSKNKEIDIEHPNDMLRCSMSISLFLTAGAGSKSFLTLAILQKSE